MTAHSPGWFRAHVADVIARPTKYNYKSWSFWEALIQRCRSGWPRRRSMGPERRALRELRARFTDPMGWARG